MAVRIAQTSLNATTLQIMNVIRQNASYEYQMSVPEVNDVGDVRKVGSIICGTPAFANQFVNALVNRIAIVRMQSATFNNPFAHLKKGYLEFGETVEDIFVSIANVVEFDVEKAKAREFKRTVPDVRTAFHVMNWRVMYPVTIEEEQLAMAFLSAEGVQSLIASIIESVYTAAEYDEYLLFKYLLIKAISHGQMEPVAVSDGTNLKTDATAYRGISNMLTFIKSQYNTAGVKTSTPKERQCIFMDAMYNAKYDVEVLASAFNMDKADFMGRLHLIDDWTTFDNERFEVIRKNSSGIEEVTADELALLANVKAVVLDENWFQVYDNKNKFTQKYIGSGLEWNYWYHVWKTVSSSPFANAVVFVADGSSIALPNTFTATVDTISTSDYANVYTLAVNTPTSLAPSDVLFTQTDALGNLMVAVQRYGAYIVPNSVDSAVTLVATIQGTEYTSANVKFSELATGSTLTFTKSE